jgi:hypothetical protein
MPPCPDPPPRPPWWHSGHRPQAGSPQLEKPGQPLTISSPRGYGAAMPRSLRLLACLACCAALALAPGRSRADFEQEGTFWTGYMSSWWVDPSWGLWFETHYNVDTFFMVRGGLTHMFDAGPGVLLGLDMGRLTVRIGYWSTPHGSGSLRASASPSAGSRSRSTTTRTTRSTAVPDSVPARRYSGGGARSGFGARSRRSPVSRSKSGPEP